MIKADSSWEESKHPRDEYGKFGSGGSKPDLVLNKVGSQKGSNPGGVYQDKSGRKFYVKFYANHHQALAEELASGLFEQLGCRTPRPRTGKVNGQDALITKWRDHFKRIKSDDFQKLLPKQQKQVATMFYAAVLTKNWDVVGTGKDNIFLNEKTRDMVEVDTGGSFRFRAMGSHKDYGDDIGELKSLRSGGHDAAEVFNNLFGKKPALEHAALEPIVHMDMDKAKKLFDGSGLPDASKLFESFKARRSKLIDHYNKLTNKEA